MGVRYGWSMLPIIFLVFTSHSIHPIPTQVKNSKTTAVSSYPFSYKQRLTHDSKIVLKTPKTMPKSSVLIKTSQVNSFFLGREFTKTLKINHIQMGNNQPENLNLSSYKKRFSLSNKMLGSEQYTIDVLPSPHPVVPDNTEINDQIVHSTEQSKLMSGIGIVAGHQQELSHPHEWDSNLNSSELFNKGFMFKGTVKLPHYYSDHVTIDAQFLPWAEDLYIGKGHTNCLDPDVIAKAARLALKKNPPPAGVTLIVHPPPRG